MTREEQIMKKVNEVCNDPNNDWKSTWDLCQMIAEWADQTMLDKVCKWLEEHLLLDAPEWYVEGEKTLQEKMIEDLRKAMKE